MKNLMDNIRALQKQAEEVAAQPNVVAEQNAATAGEQLSVNAVALQSGGTVEQQQLESLQKGLATQTAVAGADDKVQNLEKAAAVMALVQDGADFYDAVNSVADADSSLQKEAAFNDLIGQGYSFDDAVALIQQASE